MPLKNYRLCPLCMVAAIVIAASGAALTLGGAAPAPAAASSQAADHFEIDGVHSTVIWRIKHQNVSYSYGRFNKITGTFHVDAAKPEASSIDITVDADSIDSANAKRDTHLKSQDFFSTKEFPTLTFKSTSAKKGEGNAISITGDLTLHGVTKSITVPANVIGEGPGMGGVTAAGFETTFTVKRSDFGMSKMLNLLGDDVQVTVSVEGGRK